MTTMRAHGPARASVRSMLAIAALAVAGVVFRERGRERVKLPSMRRQGPITMRHMIVAVLVVVVESVVMGGTVVVEAGSAESVHAVATTTSATAIVPVRSLRTMR